MNEPLSNEPRIGEPCRVWHGPGFIREGRVLRVDTQDQEVLVEYIYDIPNEWVGWDKLC